MFPYPSHRPTEQNQVLHCWGGEHSWPRVLPGLSVAHSLRQWSVSFTFQWWSSAFLFPLSQAQHSRVSLALHLEKASLDLGFQPWALLPPRPLWSTSPRKNRASIDQCLGRAPEPSKPVALAHSTALCFWTFSDLWRCSPYFWVQPLIFLSYPSLLCVKNRGDVAKIKFTELSWLKVSPILPSKSILPSSRWS